MFSSGTTSISWLMFWMLPSRSCCWVISAGGTTMSWGTSSPAASRAAARTATAPTFDGSVADGGDPRAALGGHHGDVGVGDVGAVDPDLVFETELLYGLDGTFGELVVGREDRRDVRVGLQRCLGLLGDLGGGVVAHDADLGDLGDARMVLLELLPHRVAAIERGEAGHVDVDHFALTAGVLPEHLEHHAGDLLVALV